MRLLRLDSAPLVLQTFVKPTFLPNSQFAKRIRTTPLPQNEAKL